MSSHILNSRTARPPAAPRERAGRVVRGFGHVLLAAFVFFACFAFSEASPYDVVALPTMALWFLLGIRLHRGAVPLAMLLLVYAAAIVIALMPHLTEEAPVLWTVQLCYLVVTGLFFAMFFADDTAFRMELALRAYLASALLSAVLGVVGYLDLLGVEDLFSMYGRASGTFQDPNIFGSFLTLGVLYLLHGLLTGAARRPLLSLLALLVLLAGVFLSFSRGSWAATVLAALLTTAAVYRTSASPALRRRIVVLTGLTVLVAALALAALLSVETVAETFTKRAALTQDYDEGVTGRFGNQIRGMALLLEHPLGLGPLRWRLTFNLDPHSSFIGSFANGGWLGGVTFVALAATTAWVGLRLMLTPSPVRRHAQIAAPALLMFFLQAFQIDVEKWRHVYMLLGMVWGLEAARLRLAGSRWPGPSQALKPPSTSRVVPVMYEAAGLARNTTAAATSSGRP